MLSLLFSHPRLVIPCDAFNNGKTKGLIPRYYHWNLSNRSWKFTSACIALALVGNGRRRDKCRTVFVRDNSGG